MAWYNGHPDWQELAFDLDVERAVVVGAGNVALDVARMLALTREELVPTDTTDRAIEAIAGSPLREIVVLARRGPAQAAFTTPELKEMGDLAGADILVDPAELELDAASEAALETNTNARRNLEVLRAFAARPPAGKPRAVRLRFLVSPVSLVGDERVEAVEVVRNELVADETGRVRAVATDERETISAGLVFRSVGYHGVPLTELPFDERAGVMPNDGGRVLGANGTPLAGTYCAGWIKRGPTGVIGTNKKDATETVVLLLEDAAAGRARGAGARWGGRALRSPCGARRRRGALRGLGGDRRCRARRRRAARPAAREAVHLGRAARRSARAAAAARALDQPQPVQLQERGRRRSLLRGPHGCPADVPAPRALAVVEAAAGGANEQMRGTAAQALHRVARHVRLYRLPPPGD